MLSGVGFYFMVVPMLLMSGFQYIPALNELSIAPMVLGSWSIAFRILFYLAFIPMAMTAVMNFIITKRLMLSGSFLSLCFSPSQRYTKELTLASK
jgi:hypothetical protein